MYLDGGREGMGVLQNKQGQTSGKAVGGGGGQNLRILSERTF